MYFLDSLCCIEEAKGNALLLNTLAFVELNEDDNLLKLNM